MYNYLRHSQTAQVLLKCYLCVLLPRVSTEAVSCKFGLVRRKGEAKSFWNCTEIRPCAYAEAWLVTCGEPWYPLPYLCLSPCPPKSPASLGLRRQSMLAPDVMRQSSSSKRQLLRFHCFVQAGYETQGQRAIPKAPLSTSACYPRNGSLRLQSLPTELSLNCSLFLERLTGYALRQ